MSERITWEPCPVCGSSAAVGWAATATSEATPEATPEARPQDDPVEFDCPNGCRLSVRELARAFA